MGKEISRQRPSHAISQPTTSAKTTNISLPLQQISKHTAGFVINGRGKSLLGAGKSPEFSNRIPQQKGAKAITQTVVRSFLPKLKY